MHKVYEAESIVDAQLALDELQASGVQAVLHGGMLSGAVGELPTAGLVSLWVRHENQIRRARQVLQIYEAARKEPMPTVFCGNCGEKSEGHFSCCWNCSSFLTNA